MTDGGCKKTPFGWSCSNIEQRWIESIAQQHEEEAREHFRKVDMADRLAGHCERCQEHQDDELEVVGGEALCRECLRWERAG